MPAVNLRIRGAALLLGALVLSMTLSTQVLAQAPAVDPAATQILQRMTEYLDSLTQFSVHTQNDVEDLLDSGQRIDTVVSASVTVSRPNKLLAERRGEQVDQVFYYDGKSLTLYNTAGMVYASEPAPGTIEETLDFAQASLGLLVPAADMVYRNAYPLMMQDVTSAIVVGKTVIGGVRCDHLAVSRPDVDFQVWVADGDQPLPYMYVVTDKSTPALVSVSTVMSEWDVSPDIADERFSFVPPEGVSKIDFMPVDVSIGTQP